MIRAAFDLENPPLDPPDGADALVWRMASALRLAHQPDQTECCMTCPRTTPYPCPPSRLVPRGYLLALRIAQTPNPGHWPNVNQRGL